MLPTISLEEKMIYHDEQNTGAMVAVALSSKSFHSLMQAYAQKSIAFIMSKNDYSKLISYMIWRHRHVLMSKN